MQKIRGMEDILPQDSYKWQYVEDTARTLFELYNFQEIRTPILENVELFKRSVGDTSDIVTKEMYDFVDKGDRHIVLRPEGTASVVRSYIESKLFGPEHPQPLKVYYMGPMFRYERPQAGRQRQFHQIGMEVFGSVNPATDAEGILLAWDFFNELGLKNITVHLNTLGQPEERRAYRQALIDYFTPVKDQLSEESQRRLEDNPLRIIDSKDERDIELSKDAPTIMDYIGEETQADFEGVQAILKELGVPFVIDSTMVRGLDYYRGTIFEIIVNDDSIGAQSTICGGGRYDGLSEQLGGPHAPGFGFAIGVERVLLLIAEQQLEIPKPETLDLFVVTFGEEVNQMAQSLVQLARLNGLKADRDFLNRSVRSQFRTAERNGAKMTVALGTNELESGEFTLKSQINDKEMTVTFDDLSDNFYSIFRQLTADTSVIDEFFEGV